jgi:multiple sugar transport system substrate-binding protein
MKKLLALLLALLMLLSLAGCGKQAQEDEEPAVIELTLWTFPAGDWGDPAAVETLLTQFNSVYPDIHVTVQCLDEATGDDKLSTAVDGGVSPDILLAQPDRLIKTWGAEGMLADLSDMWDDADKQEVNAACQSVCFTRDGKCYAYPFAMNVQCMAINYDAFVTAGADQYIDLETRTWTTEQFTQAVKALQSKYGETVAAVYCSGQNGDQGTRALVTNLYGGQFANDSYTGYVANSEANQQALTLLRDTKGIEFDDAINGQEEAALFYHESLKMSFCWSLAQQLAETVDEPTEEGGEPVVHPAGKTVNGQTIEFMAFPTDPEISQPRLQGDIWGFGVFDNGDQERIEAAKLLIRFFADGQGASAAVKAAGCFPVRDTVDGADLRNIWAGSDVMTEYAKLTDFLSGYDALTPGWATARTEWWNMLQRVGNGGDVVLETDTLVENANAAAKE